MSFENFPSGSTPESNPERKTTTTKSISANSKTDYRNIVIGALAVLLIAAIAYLLWDKNKTKEEKQVLTTQIVTSDSSKNELQRELNDATLQIDMLKTSNSKGDSLIRSKDKDITDLKERVQAILNNKNATAAQLSEARGLISTLKNNIAGYTTQIEKLQGEKLQLTQEKRIVTEERDVVRKNYDSAQTVIKQKEDVIDVASTLHASNFSIIGIKDRNNGKEKVTDVAKRVSKLRISFDIDDNMVAQSGPKDLYILITSPDGKPVTVEALGSGKFNTRDGVEHYFTEKKQINYEQGQKQNVSVEWKQNSEFQVGDYKIEIWNNGFKIGEGIRNFKKGGLFS